MIQWILVVTLFTNFDHVLTKAIPAGTQEDACMEAGAQVAHDLLGQEVPLNGETARVLDAQFQCVLFTQHDHA